MEAGRGDGDHAVCRWCIDGVGRVKMLMLKGIMGADEGVHP